MLIRWLDFHLLNKYVSHANPHFDHFFLLLSLGYVQWVLHFVKILTNTLNTRLNHTCITISDGPRQQAQLTT